MRTITKVGGLARAGGVAAVAAFTVMAMEPAQAAIRCEDGFQVQKNGNRIATPYCEDDLVANVARGYGLRVSAATIRANPSEKARVCRVVGHDSRIQQICQPLTDSGRRPRWY